MEISPMGGNCFFTAFPGKIGPFCTEICPTFGSLPRHASIAMMKGFIV